MANYTEIGVESRGLVGLIEMRRAPHNYFDAQIVGEIADALEAFDRDPQCRAVVLSAQGRSFCAGAALGGPPRIRSVYEEAVRLFRTKKPIVAAVQGPAIGGGLGLALAADFRVVAREAYFTANFTKLGFHAGFGITTTLPEIVGRSYAELMLYTSRRIYGEEAVRCGLASVAVSAEELLETALALADEIAACAPLAVPATRETMRAGLADRVEAALEIEKAKQAILSATADFKEGVKASAERRPPNFIGA